MNYRYTDEDKTYDVEKLSGEGQATFNLLVTVQQRMDGIQGDLTILQASAVALHQKMKEFLDDDAIVEDDETEE
jgi:hypothetical protein